MRRGGKAMPKIIRAVKKNSDSFEEAWGTLSKALTEIHRKNASVLSFEELYRHAYNLVLNKTGDKLYAGVEAVLRAHLAECAVAVAAAFPIATTSEASRATGDCVVAAGLRGHVELVGTREFIRCLRSVWDDHTTCMVMIRDILMYMDRVYVEAARKPVVYDLGLDLFRDVVLHSQTAPICDRTVEAILNLILLEREGEIIDRSAIKTMTNMFLSLNNTNARVTASTTTSTISSYEQDFERYFLATTQEYYTLETTNLLQTCDAKGYLIKIEARLNEEEGRVSGYLSADTGPKLTSILERVLIEAHVATVIEMENSGLVVMLTNNNTEDLFRMYRLFERVPSGHRLMRECIATEIKRLGREINELYANLNVAPGPLSSRPSTAKTATENTTDPAAVVQTANPIKWVESLLEVKNRFDQLVESAFSKNKNFVNTINEAMGVVVNTNRSASEFLSLFIDENLKKGQKGKDEKDVDAILDSSVMIFRLLDQKDTFERYFKTHLAKRLLYGRSVSEDAERGFIAKLKIECGSQFTSKLEGMFQDMKVSEEMMTQFNKLPNNSNQSETESFQLSVKVLSIAIWPSFPTHSMNYPQSLLTTITRFEHFYLTKRHTGRKLTWIHNMGNADLRANFPKGRKEVNMSVFAMIILLTCFNDGLPATEGTPVPYKTILESTGIPASELKRTLQSLSLAKFRLLTKGSKGKEVLEKDEFALNLGFTAPQMKIKILTISSGSSSGGGGAKEMENDQERGETQEKIDEERKHQVEAAIVRIMKSRKRLDHNKLVVEVTEQLSSRFMPTPAMIKTRIEGLIEREYLERDANERKVYKYVA
ncbi:Cullin [Obelidium mucronatum]|nr:Cullin [Obelidium mucronatum]